MNILDEKIKEKIKNHVLTNKIEESCGFIIFDPIYDKKDIFECKNAAPSHRSTLFCINPLDFVRASQRGEILAAYHSHVSDNVDFSEYDKTNSENHSLPFVLININSGVFKEYLPQNYKNKYVGKNFEIGKNDCFSLIKEYFKQELNIDIIENKKFTNRNSQWFDEFSDAFLDGWKENPNFIRLDKNAELKKYDLILFNYFEFIKVPHHIGIYLGDGTFLHHPRDRYSTIDKLTDVYKRRIFCIARHKNFE